MQDSIWKSIQVFTFENEISSLDHLGTFNIFTLRPFIQTYQSTFYQ